MENQDETWQTEVDGQIYESSFQELTQWIFEGSLLPNDLVRRGQLRWIEARKVPSLIPFFNAKDNGLPPVVTTSTNSGDTENNGINPQNFTFAQNHNSAEFREFSDFTKSLERVNHTIELPPAIIQMAENCCFHDTEPAFYLCETCGNSFCRLCVKSYGGNVKICPMCGAMCKSLKDLNAENQTYLPEFAGEPFGFSDFARAFTHPFKFKTSLILGAFMFSLFTVGQSAANIGGIVMLSAALFCFMLANMLSFGVLKNTIDNFAQGKLDADFMPGFDDFSLWDDVIHPFFLCAGVYLVSFGLFFVIAAGGIWYSISTVNGQLNKNHGNNVSMVAPETANDLDNLKQIENFKEFQRDLNNRNQNPETAGNRDFTEEDVRQTNELIKQQQKGQLESVVGKTPETAQAEQRAMLTNLLGKAAIFVVFGLIAFLWGLFYLPAACAVAGYTQSFVSTVNPLIGLDTIKTFGFDYVKILLMSLALLIVSVSVSLVFSMILSPFDLPKVGNVPAVFVTGFITFYISTVFSCVLGYAIFKNAGKFKLYSK